jgi:plastocyanin
MAVRRAWVAWAATLMTVCALLALPLVAFAATSQVSIQGFAYHAPSITIRVGDAVTWTNQDAAQHSARFAGLGTGTAILSQGQSGSLTFTTAGTFNYDCAVHGAAMQGTVVVQAATPAPTPPPTPRPTAPPTQVRTAPPTTAATTPPTVAPTDSPTAAPTTAAPSATASATPSTTAETPSQSASPSGVAVQLTPAPTQGSGSGPLLIGAAALAVVALGAIAFFLMRRS